MGDCKQIVARCTGNADLQFEGEGNKCECGKIPRPGRTLWFGESKRVLCGVCYGNWKKNGPTSINMQVAIRPPTTPTVMHHNSVFLLAGVFSDISPHAVFEELRGSGPETEWTPMHGKAEAHLMHPRPADSHTFRTVVDKLSRIFVIQVEAYRANIYFS